MGECEVDVCGGWMLMGECEVDVCGGWMRIEECACWDGWVDAGWIRRVRV